METQVRDSSFAWGAAAATARGEIESGDEYVVATRKGKTLA